MRKADEPIKERIEAIVIDPKAADVGRYRKLLTSDWSKQFPVEVLGLLWDVLEKPLSESPLAPLYHLLDPNGRTFPNDYFSTIVGRIANALGFIHLDGLPEIPQPYSPASRYSKLALLAIRTSAYLTLSAHARLSGDIDFLTDAQALAFQSAIHSVLPQLAPKHPAEHAILLNAAALFALEFASYDPAHYAYMTSMIYGYLGDDERRLRTLYASFRFTAPNDHSFLTKAQEYWMELLDLKRYAEVEDFLFSLRWRALPNQQDEIRKMVHDAYQFIFSGNIRRS